MANNSRASCQICTTTESKYTCSKCLVRYCSVSCYKRHSESHGTTVSDDPNPTQDITLPFQSRNDVLEKEPKPLRPLTSLKWPYVPEESAFPDPLKRDDPKPLQLRHYEAIATSSAVRTSFTCHPNLPGLLTYLDKLQGPDRDRAIQRALGMTAPDISEQSKGHIDLSEDVCALRELAEAVEGAVRGGDGRALGLDWGD